MKRVIVKGRGLELRLRPRRVRIEPEAKRNEYIERLDNVIEKLEEIINSEDTDEKTRIRAANVLARLISTSYVMVRDIDIENLERELEELQKENKRMEEDPDLGYVLEGENGQILVWDKEKKERVPETENPEE